MMDAQTTYLTAGNRAEIETVFNAFGLANEQGTVGLAQEWDKVRHGEPEFFALQGRLGREVRILNLSDQIYVAR